MHFKILFNAQKQFSKNFGCYYPQVNLKNMYFWNNTILLIYKTNITIQQTKDFKS